MSDYKCQACGFERNLLIHKECPQCVPLDNALRSIINITDVYMRLCDVMMAMLPERKAELEAGSRFMDSLEALRDELLKRKSFNDKLTDAGTKTL